MLPVGKAASTVWAGKGPLAGGSALGRLCAAMPAGQGFGGTAQSALVTSEGAPLAAVQTLVRGEVLLPAEAQSAIRADERLRSRRGGGQGLGRRTWRGGHIGSQRGAAGRLVHPLVPRQVLLVREAA